MEPFKWGMIGSEERAQVFSAEATYASHPQNLHAFLPLRNDKHTNTGLLPGVNICKDIAGLLEAGINAVYVASPHNQHYEQVLQCLKRGVPVLCERPVSNSPLQLAELISLAQRNHTFLMEALWMRFMPTVKKVLSVISNDLIGVVESIRASVYYKEGGSSMPACTDIGGGALLELGVYPVFLSCLFLGKPSYVKSTGQVNSKGEDESFTAFLSYDGGQYAIIEASVINEQDSSMIIVGDKGSIHVRNPWSSKPDGIEVELADRTKMVHKSEWKGIGLYFEMDEVYSCIQRGLIESPLYNHEFCMDTANVIESIRKQFIKQ
jgi:scyllo-inositol 2-dehydrogenase (NADP+)